MKRGNILLIVLVTVAVLAIGAGGFWWWQTASAPAQKGCTLEAKICPDGSAVGRTGPNCEFAACPVDLTANWKIYTDRDYKIEFKYPLNWYAGKNYETIYVNPEPIPTMALTHGLTNAIQISYFSSSQEIFDPPWKHQSIKTELGGYPATKVVDGEPDRSDGLMRTRIFINIEKTGYVIIYSNQDSSGSHNPTFDQILATFKFLDQSTSSVPQTKVDCETKGGVWRKWGLIQKEYCQIPAADADKACSDGSECSLGKCISIDQKVPGRCQQFENIFGCFSFVSGEKISGAICVD